jgi:hypothetical protein
LKYAIIPVDWKSIVKDQDSNTNVTLFLVTKLKWQLSMKGKVTGNVLLTSEIPYEKGRGFRYYLMQ